MSQPPKKKARGKKEEGPKRVARERVIRPTASPPSPTVEVRHAGQMVTREAKGFSMAEIAQAGMGVGLAREWGLRIDGRRRTVLDPNVSALKKWSSQARKTTEEKVEGEVRKIEREVEKEARKAGKEIKKVEKEAVEKLEAPIKKRAKKTEPKPKSR